MKSWKFYLLFWAAFQLDVRVKAVSSHEPLETPVGCLQRAAVECVVEAGDPSWAFEKSGVRVTAIRESILERKDSSWRILKGAVRMACAENCDMRFPGVQVASGSGEVWVVDQGERFVVRAVRGEVTAEFVGGQKMQIPQGMETWFGRPGKSGFLATGTLSLIVLEEHLKLVNRMDRPPKAKLLAEAKDLKSLWENRVDVAAQVYDRVAQRALASEADAKREQERQARLRAAEKDKFRKMLYQRAFER